jgi:hypothetical protein
MMRKNVFMAFMMNCFERPLMANCTVGARGPSPLRKTKTYVVMVEFAEVKA